MMKDALLISKYHATYRRKVLSSISHNGLNVNALIAFVPAAAVSLCVALVPVPALQTLASFSWFIAAPLGAACYWAVMAARGHRLRLRAVAGSNAPPEP